MVHILGCLIPVHSYMCVMKSQEIGEEEEAHSEDLQKKSLKTEIMFHKYYTKNERQY